MRKCKPLYIINKTTANNFEEVYEKLKQGYLMENIKHNYKKILDEIVEIIEIDVKELEWKEYLRGYCYEIGLYNGKKDMETAVYWYTLASLRGLANAQYELGKYYDNKNEMDKAKYYYQLAEEQNFPHRIVFVKTEDNLKKDEEDSGAAHRVFPPTQTARVRLYSRSTPKVAMMLNHQHPKMVRTKKKAKLNHVVDGKEPSKKFNQI